MLSMFVGSIFRWELSIGLQHTDSVVFTCSSTCALLGGCCSFPHFLVLLLYPFQASPVGQAVFDRLLKACGSEVVWDRAGAGGKNSNQHSILVLGQVRVEAPYTSNDCHAIGDQQTSTLERVQKIVQTANTESAAVVANASSSNGTGGQK